MPTQKVIGAHLDLDQAAVSRMLAELGIDWKKAGLDDIRLAYIRKLRAVAAGHKADNGSDLIAERARRERLEADLAELKLAEMRGQLVSLAQLEPELSQMVVAFRTDVLSLPDKLKADLDALYGIDIDMQVIADPIHECLDQLARYDPERAGTGASAGGAGGAATEDDHH